MIICNECNKQFHRKFSEIGKVNFCCRFCYNTHRKKTDIQNKFINKLTKSMWTNMNVRCGKYRNNSIKNKSYLNINVKITRDELKVFITNNFDKIILLKRPSLDRIDAKKDYEVNNIQIIELHENITKHRPSNQYICGYLSKTLRGVKAECNKFSTRIHTFGTETYLGAYDTASEAYLVFYDTYLEFFGVEPFDKKLILTGA